MPGPRPALCSFPEEFVQAAWRAVRRRTVSVQEHRRFRLVLLLHERPTIGSDEAARQVELSARQVQRWRRRWSQGDWSVDDLPGRGRKAAFSPAGPCVAQGPRLPERRGVGAAAEPTIARRPGAARAGEDRPADEPQHRVPHPEP